MKKFLSFFYRRTEDDEGVTIVYTNYPWLLYAAYLLTTVMVLGLLLRTAWSQWLAIGLIPYLVAIGVIYSTPQREITDGFDRGVARVWGKKLSLRKPYTVRIFNTREEAQAAVIPGQKKKEG